ncbi:MAG: DUF763 domain-containing protein [Treponema sp.]|nr:DUF763 domain-containing protein [Treponema sp.]
MIKSTGHADLPLHTGVVPKWLSDRMMLLAGEIIEVLLLNYGRKEVLRRLSDPLWFQSFGAVLGMDWHSSGITTSVMYALKRAINKRSNEYGLYVCGGRGKYSRNTPDELLVLSDKTGLDGQALVRNSKLCAKVDNTAVQDGFQLYQHNFIVSSDGDWAVVQQGMNTDNKTARRYHWCSSNITSFVDSPHTGITGENCGLILNLTDSAACATRNCILDMSRENPDRMIREISSVINCAEKTSGQLELFDSPENTELIVENSRNIILPVRHEVKAEDIDIKRLGAVLATSYTSNPADFESLLLTKGLGPRTLQSLTLVSEVIYGTPSRFTDPARFSFAHGGKDGNPFPVPVKIYDESIRILHESIEKSKLGYNDKSECIKRLHKTSLQIERNCSPEVDFDKAIEHEKNNSHYWGGRTVSKKY